MNYAYIRVSTKQQCIDRQYEEIKALGIEKNVFISIKNLAKILFVQNIKNLLKK